MAEASADFAHFFEYLVEARRKLLDWVRSQSPSVYTQRFPLGLGSIRTTLLHIAAAEWAYVQRLAGRDAALAESPFTPERMGQFEPFRAAWEQQVPTTRAALAHLGDPGRAVEFTSRLGAGAKPMRTRATASGIAGQMLFHEVHHRAQVMAMLRQAGVAAENLDYSVLMFERTLIG